MNEMTSTELTQNTRKAIDAAKRGETTIITSYSQPVAVVAPWSGFEAKMNDLRDALGFHREAAEAAAHHAANGSTVAGDALFEAREDITNLMEMDSDREVLDALDLIEILHAGRALYEKRAQGENAQNALAFIDRTEREIADLYQSKLLRPLTGY